MNRKILILMAFFFIRCTFIPATKEHTTPPKWEGTISELKEPEQDTGTSLQKAQSMEMVAVTEKTEEPLRIPLTAHDPESGFDIDASTEAFERALIFFQAKHHREALDLFSQFLEQFPEHPLAGAALFYVAQSHLARKDHPLALKSFQKILISYEKSNRIADTLASLSILGPSPLAKNYRELLTSLFPGTPLLNLAKTQGAP
jgi:TolA-binding protein